MASWQQLERSIQRRSTLAVEIFSTPQARFREGYRKIPHESRTHVVRQAKCRPNATMFKHSDDENDDFSLLTNLISCRTLNLTILYAFPGNYVLADVEIESLQRI